MTRPIEPPLPNPPPPRKSSYNLRVPPTPLQIMVIDRVNGFITTYEAVNQVTRAIPRNEEAVDSQITAARLCGTLVVERVHTNEHWLAPRPDARDAEKG